MDWILQNWTTVLDAVAYIIAAASVITTLTPTPKDNEILAKIVNVLRLLGLNVGAARPAP